MDIMTHGLAGALVGLAAGRPTARWGTLAAVAGALAPDADVLARLWDPLTAVTVHRTVTHSLVGGLPRALAVGVILRVARVPDPLGSLAAVAYAGVLSHIALDLLNPFGTAVLWPFEGRRLALGWLYVIDPVVIALALGGLVVAWRWPVLRVSAARAAVVTVAAYAGVAGALSGAADAEFRRRHFEPGGTPVRTVVVPIFPGPLRWMGVAETTTEVTRARFWLGWGAAAPMSVISKGGPVPADSVETLPGVRAFRAVARVPLVRVSAESGGTLVEYHDLAFEDHPGGGPMVLSVRLDETGALHRIELGHRF